MKAVHEMETKAPDLAVTPGILYSQPPQVLFWALGSLHHLMVQKSCLAVALLFPHPQLPSCSPDLCRERCTVPPLPRNPLLMSRAI